MPQNPRFQVRDDDEELKKLDNALIKLGYKKRDGSADRTRWYEDKKNESIKEAEKLPEL